jgi:hypothetical protein
MPELEMVLTLVVTHVSALISLWLRLEWRLRREKTQGDLRLEAVRLARGYPSPCEQRSDGSRRVSAAASAKE